MSLLQVVPIENARDQQYRRPVFGRPFANQRIGKDQCSLRIANEESPGDTQLAIEDHHIRFVELRSLLTGAIVCANSTILVEKIADAWKSRFDPASGFGIRIGYNAEKTALPIIETVGITNKHVVRRLYL